eukprot:717963_1
MGGMKDRMLPRLRKLRQHLPQPTLVRQRSPTQPNVLYRRITAISFCAPFLLGFSTILYKAYYGDMREQRCHEDKIDVWKARVKWVERAKEQHEKDGTRAYPHYWAPRDPVPELQTAGPAPSAESVVDLAVIGEVDREK